jgi:hypothetical protein
MAMGKSHSAGVVRRRLRDGNAAIQAGGHGFEPNGRDVLGSVVG